MTSEANKSYSKNIAKTSELIDFFLRIVVNMKKKSCKWKINPEDFGRLVFVEKNVLQNEEWQFLSRVTSVNKFLWPFFFLRYRSRINKTNQ